MRTVASQPAQQQKKEPPTLCEREKEKAKGSLNIQLGRARGREGWGRIGESWRTWGGTRVLVRRKKGESHERAGRK